MEIPFRDDIIRGWLLVIRGPNWFLVRAPRIFPGENRLFSGKCNSF